MSRFAEIAVLIGTFVASSFSQVYLTKDEALKLAFPERAKVERKTVFLTDEQVEWIQKMAKAKLESKVVTYYVGSADTGVIGYAFFETHVVRTMPETFMAVIGKNGRVQMVEILAFYEPEDYRPSARWLGQFTNRELSDDLWLKRGIRTMSGATISAQKITEGVRRTLAIYQAAIRSDR